MSLAVRTRTFRIPAIRTPIGSSIELRQPFSQGSMKSVAPRPTSAYGWRVLEVVVVLRRGADAGMVAQTLRRHGLDVVALTAGLLATGDVRAVEAAFGRLDDLRVPEALGEHVESVAVVPPKRLLGAD